MAFEEIFADEISDDLHEICVMLYVNCYIEMYIPRCGKFSMMFPRRLFTKPN